MSTNLPPLDTCVQHLSHALVRMTAQRDAVRSAYHAAVAMLREVTVERDIYRADRNRLLDEIREARHAVGQSGVRGPKGRVA